MKPYLFSILALLPALVLNLSGETVPSPPSTQNGLSCKISIPSLVADKDGLIGVELVVSNVSAQPIRLCAMNGASRSVFPARNIWYVHLTPEFWKDRPTPESFRKNVKALQPNESLSIPFSVDSSNHQPITIEATFSVSAEFARQYGTWQGCIQDKATDVKIQYQESSKPSVAPGAR